jgi:hypothetical protein
MKIRARLQRLEKTCSIDHSCPACRERRGRPTLVIREQLADGMGTEPNGMPAPCVKCGQIPEQIIEIVEKIVASPAAVGGGAEDVQAGESWEAAIGGGSDIA